MQVFAVLFFDQVPDGARQLLFFALSGRQAAALIPPPPEPIFFSIAIASSFLFKKLF